MEIKSATNGKFSNLKWWTEVFSAVIQFPYLCIWCNPLLLRAVLKFRGISCLTLSLFPRGRDPFGQRRTIKGTPGDEIARSTSSIWGVGKRLGMCSLVSLTWRVLKSDTFYNCPKTRCPGIVDLIFNPYFGVKISQPSGFEVFPTTTKKKRLRSLVHPGQSSVTHIVPSFLLGKRGKFFCRRAGSPSIKL